MNYLLTSEWMKCQKHFKNEGMHLILCIKSFICTNAQHKHEFFYIFKGGVEHYIIHLLIRYLQYFCSRGFIIIILFKNIWCIYMILSYLINEDYFINIFHDRSIRLYTLYKYFLSHSALVQNVLVIASVVLPRLRESQPHCVCMKAWAEVLSYSSWLLNPTESVC